MARRPEPEMATINARKRLPARPKPYWRHVTSTLQIGCYLGKAVTWRARRYLGDGKRDEVALGLAEDTNRTADGETVLTFNQAIERARAWQQAQENPAPVVAELPSVEAAIAAYAETRKAQHARGGADAAARLAKHLPESDGLSCMKLDQIDAAALRDWRGRLSADLAPATVNRLLNDVRAALNEAGRLHRARLASSFADAVRDGLRGLPAATQARDIQILPDADIRRIIAAAYSVDADFGALVLALAATGCRFDQAARLTVTDLQAANRRLMVPTSKKGRGPKARTHIPCPLLDDVMARLRPLVAGRRGTDPLLMHWHHRQEAGDKDAGKLPKWVRNGRRPWRVAADMARPWRKALAAAELPADIVPYALRHSSIVRALNAGASIRLVAAAHDTSTAMIERHYSAFIVEASEVIHRAALIPLEQESAEVVQLLDRRR